jgi:tetratricopeptide (TPR) repeat protein
MSIPLPISCQDSRIRLHLLLIGGACIALYAITLFNGFVYDDHFQVLENPWITDLRSVPKMFTTGVWEFEGDVSNYYRPLMHLSYALTYQISGLQPWGYHAVNLLLHTAVSLLVFLTALSLLDRSGEPGSAARLPALLGALFFAAHPILTETVAWVACVPELSFTFFSLLALLLYARAENVYSAAFAASVAAYFAATICKETAVILPVLLVPYDYAFRPGRPRLAGVAKRYGPFVLATGAYLVIRLSVLPAFAPIRRHASLTMSQYLINVFPLFTEYLGKLLLPTNLNAYHVLHPILTLWSRRGILALLLTAAFGVAAALASQRSRRILFALGLIVLPLLPVLYVPALGENTFTERYLYLPTVGFAFITTFGLAWVQRRRPDWMGAGVVLTVVVLGVYSVATVHRNTVWRSDETLWRDTVRKSPESASVHNEMGIVLAARGAVEAAIGEYQTALRLDPGLPRAHNNLGTLLEQKGQIDQAIEHYLEAIAASPSFAKAYNNLGNAYVKKGRLKEAVEAYRAALGLKPGMFETYLNLGNVYSEMGLFDDAMKQYEAAARLKPESADTHLHVGIAYGVQGKLDEAIAHLETAARLNPADPVIYQNLAHAYDLKGFHDKATEERRRAAALTR